MSYHWSDLVGNVGVLMILVTYGLLQLERLASTSPIYSGFNALGAALILISLTVNFNFSAFIIEIFWLMISLFGLWRHQFHQPQKKKKPDH
ncbi:MAG: hypothetical protein AAGB12_14530 [Pseudomonadota bacterium]